MLAGAASYPAALCRVLRPSSTPLRCAAVFLLSLPRPSLFSSQPSAAPKFCFLASDLVNPTCRARAKSESEGFWEDPDDGYGSEYAEEEEEGEEGGVWEKGGAQLSAAQYEEELVKEVELLLTAEEKALLDDNGDPDVTKISTPKWYPLHSFALSGQISFMDEHLQIGIDMDSADRDGFTPLHKAVMGKKEAVISHLLRKGSNPHVTDRDGATPLHYAVQAGAIQTVKLLIKYKVDVNIADNDGWTPLHLAIQSRNRDIAKVLLVNGADKTRRNKDGKTALDLSLCYGKDFKSYDLARLVKLVPANRTL